MTTPKHVSGTIRQLEWDCHPDAGYDRRRDEHYGGKQSDLSGKNEYDIYPHPCAYGLYVLDVMGSRTDQDFPSVEAAKAAAQADYNARILAAIQPDPDPSSAGMVSVEAAARVLLARPTAVNLLAQNYDREDAALIGEPDPWLVDDKDHDWEADRVSCARAALRALAGERG